MAIIYGLLAITPTVGGPMLIMRFLALLIGSGVLFGAPFLLLPDAPQSRPDETIDVIQNCAIVLLIVSGYFFVGVLGHRMRRSLRRRLIAAVLLSFPVLAGGYAIFSGVEPELLPFIGPLLCITAFMYVGFVFPSNRRRSSRALRSHEESDRFLPERFSPDGSVAT
jgi:UDP-N-acetylmuramyl pentapeptide phosphotransferase/UDP-N-acetylglucosamine-1-phosphate transferase